MHELLLRVETPEGSSRPFCAGSVWTKQYGRWKCIEAAPILYWMVTAHPDNIKCWLERNNLKHEWIKV